MRGSALACPLCKNLPRTNTPIPHLWKSLLEFPHAHRGDNRASCTCVPLLPTLGGPSASLRRTSPDRALDRVLQFQIAEDTDARIHFRGPPNRPAIRKLIALLELSADTFPE